MAFYSKSSIAKLTSRYRYGTRNNQRLIMDQLEQNQDVIREDMIKMRTQMVQLMKTIQPIVIG